MWNASRTQNDHSSISFFAPPRSSPSWDPEVIVGGSGRLQGKTGLAFCRKKQGIFFKEENIYKKGLAEKCDIHTPQEHGVDSIEGISWITSKNAKEVDLSAGISSWVDHLAFCRVANDFDFCVDPSRQIPALVSCKAKPSSQ